MNQKIINQWTKKSLLETASQFKTLRDFRKAYRGGYAVAHSRGWLADLHTIFNHPKVWTDEEIIAEGQKYNSQTAFYRSNSAAASEATKRGLIIKFQNNHVKWTDFTIAQEAKKYQTRSDFQVKARSAYAAARRKGILDHVCKHMKDARRKNYD